MLIGPDHNGQDPETIQIHTMVWGSKYKDHQLRRELDR